MKRFKKVVSYMLVIFWMGMIFYLSHQPAVDSGGLSGGIAEMILEVVEKLSSNKFNFNMLDYIVRKNAHLFIYLVLSILVLNALKISKIKGYKSFLWGLTICVFYAATDEIHQLFIPGRSGEIRDVLIDSSGVIFGMIIYGLFNRIKNVVIIFCS